ncbi:hypothetical protein Cal7507_4848 [Calothrix sp. PCC 7507]|nr:hypothetical protein Cal7507_4848 [Calothrix sp. PCC 7507]
MGGSIGCGGSNSQAFKSYFAYLLLTKTFTHSLLKRKVTLTVPENGGSLRSHCLLSAHPFTQDWWTRYYQRRHLVPRLQQVLHLFPLPL